MAAFFVAEKRSWCVSASLVEKKRASRKQLNLESMLREMGMVN